MKFLTNAILLACCLKFTLANGETNRSLMNHEHYLSKEDTTKQMYFAGTRGRKALKKARSGINMEAMKSRPASGVWVQLVKYSVDTIFDKPHANRLMVIAGAQGDGSYYGAYARARINLGRLLQVGGIVAAPFTSAPSNRPDIKYSVIEGQAAFFFSDKMERDNRAFFIKGQNLQIMQDMKTGKELKKPIGSKVEALMPVPKSVQLGFCGGFFNWTRPITRGAKDSGLFVAQNTVTGSKAFKENLYTNVNVTGFAAGFAMTTNAKAKYKFHVYEQEQVLEKVAENEYKTLGQKPLKSRGSKKGLRDVSVDLALEFLMAPAIIVRGTSTLLEDGIPVEYTITDLKKKYMGGRVRADIRNKIWSLRMEIGTRPGASNNIPGSSETPKILRGAYYLLGVGFGIGAL